MLVEGQVQNTNGPHAAPPAAVTFPGRARSNLEIHYTSLNLGAADRARFRYRLSRMDGRDEPVERGRRPPLCAL